MQNEHDSETAGVQEEAPPTVNGHDADPQEAAPPAPKKRSHKKKTAPAEKKAAAPKAKAKAKAKKEPKPKKIEDRYELKTGVKADEIRSKGLAALVKIAREANRPLTVTQFVEKTGKDFPSKNVKSLVSYLVRKSPKVFEKA